MVKIKENIINQKFGHLKVLYQTEDYIIKDGKCQNTLIVSEKEQLAYLPYNNIKLPLNRFKNAPISRFRESIDLILHRENGSIFQAIDLGLELMFNYKLPLPIIPVIILHNGTMICYNELLYYIVRCICGEDTSQEYSKLEAYKQNNIKSKWVNILCYEPYDDNFTEEELKSSFEIFNDKKYTSEFFNDYCKELNRLSKTLKKYE